MTRNSAKKIGICRIRGRQEANGLVPVSFHSFICSWVRRSRSCLYFCWSALICGWRSCMLRLDLICLTNSGISSVRIVTVSPTIDSAHVQPESLRETDRRKEPVPDQQDAGDGVVQRRHDGADPMSPRKSNMVLLCVTVAPGHSLRHSRGGSAGHDVRPARFRAPHRESPRPAKRRPSRWGGSGRPDRRAG